MKCSECPSATPLRVGLRKCPFEPGVAKYPMDGCDRLDGVKAFRRSEYHGRTPHMVRLPVMTFQNDPFHANAKTCTPRCDECGTEREAMGLVEASLYMRHNGWTIDGRVLCCGCSERRVALQKAAKDAPPVMAHSPGGAIGDVCEELGKKLRFHGNTRPFPTSPFDLPVEIFCDICKVREPVKAWGNIPPGWNRTEGVDRCPSCFEKLFNKEGSFNDEGKPFFLECALCGDHGYYGEDKPEGWFKFLGNDLCPKCVEGGPPYVLPGALLENAKLGSLWFSESFGWCIFIGFKEGKAGMIPSSGPGRKCAINLFCGPFGPIPIIVGSKIARVCKGKKIFMDEVVGFFREAKFYYRLKKNERPPGTSTLWPEDELFAFPDESSSDRNEALQAMVKKGLERVVE